MNYETHTLGEFTSAIASAKLTPAGGTAAAVVGAIGASLCEMVCTHTLRGVEDGATKPGLVEVRDDLGARREQLLTLSGRDAAVVEELFGSGGDGVTPSGLKRSVGVPLAIAEACLTVLELATVVTESGARNAVADGVTGTLLARSALRASLFTVRCNLEMVEDPSFVDEVERRSADIESRAERAIEQVRTTVGCDP